MPHAAVVALVPAPDELVVEYLAIEPGRLLVVASARRVEVTCPACGGTSCRVQSRYERSLADLPWHGLTVALRLRVRRFVCGVPDCPRHVFCERLPATTVAYARRTTRLASALELIGLALGGEAGARLARELGMAAGASADTLLRVLKTPRPTVEAAPVRVLGVDDGSGASARHWSRVRPLAPASTTAPAIASVAIETNAWPAIWAALAAGGSGPRSRAQARAASARAARGYAALARLGALHFAAHG